MSADGARAAKAKAAVCSSLSRNAERLFLGQAVIPCKLAELRLTVEPSI
jgi:hypothetical protein